MSQTHTEIKPTRIFHPFGDVEVRLFGRNGGETDWSIRQLNEKTAKKTTPQAIHTFSKIHPLVAAARVSILLAPYPAFNAKVCKNSALRTEFETSDDAMPEADFPDNWSWVLCRGVKADGCEVPRPNIAGFWLSSADCPSVVAHSPSGRLICAHAGGRSLYDEELVLTGKKSREHSSVIDAIARELGNEMSRTLFFITCGVCGEHFQHSVYDSAHGTRHRHITQYLTKNLGQECVWGNPEKGQWSLKDIIAAQLIRYGVLPSQISSDNICTYSDADADGKPVWWSYERSTDTADGKELCRNGVLVFRHS